jgi:antitoxin YobK
MSMDNLLLAFQIIEEHKHGLSDFCGEKEASLLQKAEEVLGLTFPPTYRLFLKKLGCGGFGGFEVYGLIDNNFYDSGIPNGIWLTLRHRKLYNLPHQFIIISDLGYGPFYVLDASKPNTDGEYPVLVLPIGYNPINTEKANEDFGDFLLEQINQSLSDEEE